MIYIPRFKKRSRLDTRGGMSPNVPAVSDEAIRAEAMSKVLDTVATKILPIAFELDQEAELEKDKTFINDIRTNLSDKFREAPLDPSQEWYDGNIQSIHDEAKKSDRYKEGVAKVVDNIFKEKNNAYSNRIVNYRLKTVGSQKQKNLMDSLVQDIKEADANNKLSIDAIYDAKFNSLTENLLWEEKTRTGKELAQRDKIEFFNRADISDRVDNFDKVFKGLIKNKISQEIKALPDSIPLNEKVDIIEGIIYPKTQVQSKEANDLKEKSGIFGFLDTAKFYELDSEEFSNQLISEVFKTEDFKNKREARLKEELTFEERDRISNLNEGAKAFAVAGKEKEYNQIKDELEDNNIWIKPFSAATNSKVKTAMAKQEGRDKYNISKKLISDPDYFAGDYIYKEKKLKEMGISNPNKYMGFLISMDKKEAVKVRSAIRSSYRYFNLFNAAVSKEAPGFDYTKGMKNIEGLRKNKLIDDGSFSPRIEALNKNYINKMKLLETEMTDALQAGDTTEFRDDRATGFHARAKVIFNEEIYQPYKAIIEEAIQNDFVVIEAAHMDGGDGGLARAFTNFQRDYDKDETTTQERDRIIADLARSLKQQKILDDDQQQSLKMISKALPVLKQIKNVSDLERVAREVNKKQEDTIGQITN